MNQRPKKREETTKHQVLAVCEQRIDELQQRLTQAEAVSRNKTEFLMGLGFDLRTPLNGIMGMTNLVLESELTETQRGRLEMVTSSAERLLEVINDILDFCRIESGSLQLICEDFDLYDLLDYELYLLRLAARQKNLDLDYRIDPAVPRRINSDPDRLVQVLANLVDNAIKFTEQGGITVLVEGPDGANDAAGIDKTSLKITVSDTGIGIAPEKQRELLDRLNREQNSPISLSCGRELGLAVSSYLAGLTGGEIGFRSNPGIGSTFWFRWYCGTVDEKRGATSVGLEREALVTNAANRKFIGQSVLLAEDEPISRVLIETLLEQVGIHVVSAENGEQAVAMAMRGSFRAVLMDVQMPIMDGLTATRQIREQEKKTGGHLTIIALTARAMQGDREKCLQAGMDDYLAKPVQKLELYHLLDHYLTNSALVITGDKELQQTILACLIENNWRVTLAETGRSAAYEASLSHFNLVVLDMEGEEKRGADTIKTIRKLETFTDRRSRIVAICGTASATLIDTYRDAGAETFLDRTLVSEELTKHLSR